MIVIDKIRKYIHYFSKNEEQYYYVLDRIYVNPKYRNKECIHPEHDTCENCTMNSFKGRIRYILDEYENKGDKL